MLAIWASLNTVGLRLALRPGALVLPVLVGSAVVTDRVSGAKFAVVTGYVGLGLNSDCCCSVPFAAASHAGAGCAFWFMGAVKRSAKGSAGEEFGGAAELAPKSAAQKAVPAAASTAMLSNPSLAIRGGSPRIPIHPLSPRTYRKLPSLIMAFR